MKRSNALWGTLLIFAGLFWILDSTHVVNIDLWGSVITLWPIFIIAAGITFFLRPDSHIPRVILWILVFALIGGYGIYLGYQISDDNDTNKKYIMKPDIQSAAIEVSITGATFNIDAGDTDLADIRTDMKGLKSEFDDGISPRITYSQKFQHKAWNKKQNFNARLNSGIPWNIELNTGTCSGTLDFKDFPLNGCIINTGACDLNIMAGNKQKEARIVINGAAVNLKIDLPEDVGLKINSSSAATKINGNINLMKENNVYQSDNYTTAPDKLYLDIASAACNISINR